MSLLSLLSDFDEVNDELIIFDGTNGHITDEGIQIDIIRLLEDPTEQVSTLPVSVHV